MTTIRIYLLNEATGERTTVQLPDTMPVSRATAALVGQLHLPVGDYQLLYEQGGKRLSNGRTLAESGVASGTYLALRENRTKGRGQAFLSLLIGLIAGLGTWGWLFYGTLNREDVFLRETWGIGNVGVLICMLGIVLALRGRNGGRQGGMRLVAGIGLWLSGSGALAALAWMILSGVAWIAY
ncbi:MAG: hypothetical protein JXJ17_08870 [Anaerolineae bacterium]|nr:hypothetical protein [Anaerolineae bacterium]